MTTLAKQITYIKEKVYAASLLSPYKQDVKIIAVTKTHPPEVLKEAYDCGLKEFGENRVQELLAKKHSLPQDITWHLIGPLQSNKVKAVLPHVHLIHSLDRESLAEEIDKRAEILGINAHVLIEVNVARENTKHGIFVEEISDFLHYLSGKENLTVKGLMTVAPFCDNPEEVRWVFRKLYEKYSELQTKQYQNQRYKILHKILL